jgi:hypothetical protein
MLILESNLFQILSHYSFGGIMKIHENPSLEFMVNGGNDDDNIDENKDKDENNCK